MLQTARLQSLEDFRTGESLLLLATDVAARGLDILGVQAVINYNCPRTLDTYLHRVGRTARAGAHGLAISLVEDKDRLLVKAVMKHACKKLNKRELPKGIVHAWRAKVEALTGSVEDVLMVRPASVCTLLCMHHTGFIHHVNEGSDTSIVACNTAGRQGFGKCARAEELILEILKQRN